LFSPLANLLNLSSLTLKLESNKIGDIGASSLLSPFANLLNLSTLSLDLSYNVICDIGAYSLFFPLSSLINLSILNLQLINTFKTKQTGHLFIHYFKKIKYLELKGWICIYWIFFCYLNMVNQYLNIVYFIWKNKNLQTSMIYGI